MVLLVLVRGYCWLNEYHIDAFSLHLEELLVGKFKEVVHFVYFGVVEQERQLFLVGLV